MDAQLQTVLSSWKKPLLKFLFRICGRVVLVIDWMWRWESEKTFPALKNGKLNEFADPYPDFVLLALFRRHGCRSWGPAFWRDEPQEHTLPLQSAIQSQSSVIPYHCAAGRHFLHSEHHFLAKCCWPKYLWYQSSAAGFLCCQLSPTEQHLICLWNQKITWDLGS